MDGAAYTLKWLLAGEPRVLYAPMSIAEPNDVNDIIDVETPYAVKDGWVDFGAAREGSQAERSIETQELRIQQLQVAVAEDITDIPRSFTTSVAEITPENLQIIENSPSIDVIPGGAHASAQHKVPFGSIAQLTNYRVALIGQRIAGKGGDVTESGGKVRGSFVGLVYYAMTLSKDNAQTELAQGTLAHLPITFKANPVDGKAQGEEVGFWVSEDPGQTIVAA